MRRGTVPTSAESPRPPVSTSCGWWRKGRRTGRGWFGSRDPEQLLFALTDPQPVAVRVVQTDFEHAVEGLLEIGNRQPVRANLLVILGDVVRIQVDDGVARGSGRRVDRLVDHQLTVAVGEPRPPPLIIALLDLEAELPVEVDARRHAAHRK